MVYKVEKEDMRAVVLYRAEVRRVGINRDIEDPRPSLKGGDYKEGEHGLHDVVIVERTPDPLPRLHYRLVDVSIIESDELPLAGCVVVHGQVGAHEKLPLEQLHSDDSKHEYEEHCHSHDISDRLH